MLGIAQSTLCIKPCEIGREAIVWQWVGHPRPLKQEIKGWKTHGGVHLPDPYVASSGKGPVEPTVLAKCGQFVASHSPSAPAGAFARGAITRVRNEIFPTALAKPVSFTVLVPLQVIVLRTNFSLGQQSLGSVERQIRPTLRPAHGCQTQAVLIVVVGAAT